MDFSAVILAGGRSSRMGRNKAWLEYRGRPLIVNQLETVRACKPAQIFISAASPAHYSGLGWPILADNFPGSGPLGGIERALEAAASPFILVLAVDMPFITSGTLRRLAAHVEPNRGVVPRIEDRVQPLAAFYSKSAHATLLRLLGEGLNSAVHFADTCVGLGLARYSDLHKQLLDEFANWNTPDDVARGSAA
jgi:molybdopterin-guanine dinucleotide biosynthesis protein A